MSPEITIIQVENTGMRYLSDAYQAAEAIHSQEKGVIFIVSPVLGTPNLVAQAAQEAIAGQPFTDSLDKTAALYKQEIVRSRLNGVTPGLLEELDSAINHTKETLDALKTVRHAGPKTQMTLLSAFTNLSISLTRKLLQAKDLPTLSYFLPQRGSTAIDSPHVYPGIAENTWHHETVPSLAENIIILTGNYTTLEESKNILVVSDNKGSAEIFGKALDRKGIKSHIIYYNKTYTNRREGVL